MTGKSLGTRGSHGKLSVTARKPSSKMQLSGSREKDCVCPAVCRYFGRTRVAMLLLFALALLVIIGGSFTVSKESTSPNYKGLNIQIINNGNILFVRGAPSPPPPPPPSSPPSCQATDNRLSSHPCKNFALPPPPPSSGRRKHTGPRPCPVCYVSVDQAKASMPSCPSESPIVHNLEYIIEKNPVKTEPYGGSDFGGYLSLEQRNDFFNIREKMEVACGFVKGKPARQTGFDIDEDVLLELEQFHEVIVASAIFGNYDLIQQPENISEEARKNVPFYMFIDEETESYMKKTGDLDSSMRVGLWRIIVVHNVPYTDSRRNGKVPKLLLHRILPNVRYSIWIDGKLKLVRDPYQLLERFLWREKANYAISKHYSRFSVLDEADANKAGRKYDNASIDYQIEFYIKEGLTPYSEAKLPITSDVPEGCVIIREHVPITNLFSCLWFNEVDRFTSRDQLSFSTVRDKIMANVNWTINMFLDCERRNFVTQLYHKDLLDKMPRPPAAAVVVQHPPPPPHHEVLAGKIPGKISPKQRERRRNLRLRRKARASN